MKTELHDIKYHIQQIESFEREINNINTKIDTYKGKPFYQTCLDRLVFLDNSIKDSYNSIDYFYKKMNK